MTAEIIWQIITIIWIPVVAIIFNAIGKLRSDLNDLHVTVTRDYANKSDLQRIEAKIDSLQSMIIDAIKGKVL